MRSVSFTSPSSVFLSAYRAPTLEWNKPTSVLASALICVLTAVATPALAQQSSQIITTLIGPDAMCGEYSFKTPSSVALDKNGNIYVSSDYVICKRGTDGTITKLAGTDVRGFDVDGDNRLAQNAKLNEARGLAVDDNENVYFADRSNGRIRRIDAVSGLITTVMGEPDPKYLAPGSKEALSYTLQNPQGVAIDRDGNFYVAATNNYQIYKVKVSDLSVTHIGGFMYPMFTQPATGNDARDYWFQADAIAVGKNGMLYVADNYNKYIYKIDVDHGRSLSIIGGRGGPGYIDSREDILAVDASITELNSVAVDGAGNVYYSDRASNRFRKISASTGRVSTFAGTLEYGYSGDGGDPKLAQFNFPFGVAVADDGNFYLADSYNDRLRMIAKASAALPPAVAGLKTVTGDGQVTVSWAAPTGEGADSITGFTVTSAPEAKTCEAKANETSCIVTGLSNTTNYVFSVVANSAAGSGAATPTAPVQPVASLTVPGGATLPQAVVGSNYSASISPTGGTVPYHFRITQGALPAGLSAAMSADGTSILITGTPSRTETASFTLEISDSTVPKVQRFSLAKAGPTVTTTTQSFALAVSAADVIPPTVVATPVPGLNQWGLALLSTMLAGMALIRRRDRSGHASSK